MVQYKCPKCAALLESPDASAGQQEQCPACNELCTVPPPKEGRPLLIGLVSASAFFLLILTVVIIAFQGDGRSQGWPLSPHNSTSPDVQIDETGNVEPTEEGEQPVASPAEDTLAAPDTQPITAEAGTYHVIPIRGKIGRDFTAQDMADQIALAREFQPDVVILFLDTGGGNIFEAEDIINLIIKNDDLRFVAYVRQALSAGAAIAMTCPEIYVEEVATIGGALSYKFVESIPTPVAEKFQSMWRAVCRKAAQHGNHSGLLAEAMVDSELELTMRTEGGTVILERGGDGDVLSARGRLLTLTAEEAVECSLATAVVAGPADFQSRLGLTDADSDENFLEAAAHVPEHEEGSPAALFQELGERRAEFGFGSQMTTLQKERAAARWASYLANVGKGRQIAWSVAVIDIEEISVQAVRKELAQLQRYIQMAGNELGAATTSQDKQLWRLRLDVLAEAATTAEYVIARIQERPFGVIADAGKGRDSGWVLAYVSQYDRSVMENSKPGDSILLRGAIQQIAVIESADGEIRYVVHLRDCTADAP